ncbi:MAG: hypothetical protein ACK5CZ_07865 [Bacteroidota bacterium]
MKKVIRFIPIVIFWILVQSSHGQSIDGIIIPGATSSSSGSYWDVSFLSSTTTATAKENYKEIKIIQNKTQGNYLVFDAVSGASDWEIVQGNPGSASWFSFCKPMLENDNACSGTCTTSYYIRNIGTSTGEYTAQIRIGLSTASTSTRSSACTYDTSTAFRIKATVNKVASTGIYKWTEPTSGTDSSWSVSSNWTPSRTSASSADMLIFDLATNTTMRNTTVYLDGVNQSVSQVRISPYNNVTFKCSTSSNSGTLKIGESTSATGTDFIVDTLAGLRIDGGTITARIETGNTSLFKSTVSQKAGTLIFDGAGSHVFHRDLVLNGGTMKFQPASGTNTLRLRGRNTKLTGSGGTLYLDSNMNVTIGNGATSTFTLEREMPVLSKLTLEANTTLASNSPTNYSSASNVNGFTPYLQLKATAKANSTAYGQILAIPATSSITGGTQFEIFCNKQRSFRTIGLPFSTGMIIPQFTDDIDISGIVTSGSSNANEFTTSCSTCNSSLFNWVESSSTWSAYTSGNSVSTISQGNGVLLLFRGAKGNGLGDTTVTATAQVLDFKGVLSQGSYSFTLSNSGSGTYKGYNLISNPYPCTIDLREVYESNRNTILPRFYLYDAIARRYNAWDSVGKSGNAPSRTGTSNFNSSSNRNKSKLLAPGAAAFFIVDNSGSSTTLTFNESHKYSGASSVTNHFSNGVQELTTTDCNYLSADLHFQDSKIPESDGFTLEFDQEGENDQYDIRDMPKLHAYLGFGTVTDGNEWLSIDRRGVITNQENSRSLPLKVVYPKLSKLDLEITFDLCDETQSQYQIYFVDKLAQKTILVENGAVYPFTAETTIDKKSDRFELVFQGKGILMNQKITNRKFVAFPNPVERTLQILDPQEEIRKISLVNSMGQTLFTKEVIDIKSLHAMAVGELPNGFYQLFIEHKTGNCIQSILKK